MSYLRIKISFEIFKISNVIFNKLNYKSVKFI